MIGIEDGPELDDLQYIPPPAVPLALLHPSRMTPRRSAEIGLRALRPARTAEQLRAHLEVLSGRDRCLLTGSGRAALRMALAELGAAGRDVVLSTFNCPAVVDAVIAGGARPVFVDFDPDSGPVFDSVDVGGRVVLLTNGLGHDEWAGHGERIRARGGRPLLDLAQAVPAPDVLSRYRLANCSVVLSFGQGKSLGALGGGALLTSTPAPPAASNQRVVAHGAAAMVNGIGEQALLRAPRPVRAAVENRRRRAPGWSTTKADHLGSRIGPVPLTGPDRWQVAGAAVMLDSAEQVRTAAAALQEGLRSRVAGHLRTCRMVASSTDLSSGIDLVFHRRGDRLQFGRHLSALGVQSTWNYYPLHRMPAYAMAGTGTMPSVEALWPRLLSLPKLPQPRISVDLLADAIIDADRATGGRHA